MTLVVVPSLALGRGKTIVPTSALGCALEFDESQHPRDSHGRFGDKGGEVTAADITSFTVDQLNHHFVHVTSKDAAAAIANGGFKLPDDPELHGGKWGSAVNVGQFGGPFMEETHYMLSSESGGPLPADQMVYLIADPKDGLKIFDTDPLYGSAMGPNPTRLDATDSRLTRAGLDPAVYKANDNGGMFGMTQGIAAAARAAGYDGVKDGFEEMAIFDPKNVNVQIPTAKGTLTAAGWDPDLHPRDAHGRFGEGGQGATAEMQARAIDRTIAALGEPKAGSYQAQELDRVRAMSPEAFLHDSMTYWRGSGITSSNMRAVAEGRPAAPAYAHDVYLHATAYMLADAVQNAPPLGHDVYRADPSEYRTGDTFDRPLLAAATHPEHADEFRNNPMLGKQVTTYRISGAHGLTFDDNESIIGGRFRAESDNHLVYDPGATLTAASISSALLAPAHTVLLSVWLSDFDESKHPRGAHGRFGDKADDGGVLGVGEIKPSIDLPTDAAIEQSVVNWQYYADCSNARYAAECMLGQDHPTIPNFASVAQTTGDYGVLHALEAGRFLGDQDQETQTAVDDAHNLLLGILAAQPSDVPLFRGLPLDPHEPGTAALQALKPGDTFDLSLASFSNDRNLAESFAMGRVGEPKMMLTLADGGKGVFSEQTAVEVHVGGRIFDSGNNIGTYDGGAWVPGHQDVVVGGRLEVVAVHPYVPEAVNPEPSKYTTEVVVRQVGVFDPDHGGALIPTRQMATASARPSSDYQRPAFWREFGPTPDRKSGSAPITAGGFDEALHPRGHGGKFAPKDDAATPSKGGTTYVTRFGPDVPAGGDPKLVASTVAKAAGFEHFGSYKLEDAYPHADDIANYADVPRHEESGEPLPPPDKWEPGNVYALSEAATYWQQSFENSRGVQAAADELLGYRQSAARTAYEGDPEPKEAAVARELLNAMAGGGPEGAASAFSLSPEMESPTLIGVQDFGSTELARGMDDKTGEMSAVFQQALDTNGTVQWSMASFVQGGDAGQLRMDTLAQESGDAMPGAYDETTGDFIDQHPDDNAAETALQYAGGGGNNNNAQPEAPMLIRTSGQGLNLDGGWEALVGGKFSVESMRTATSQELDAWNAHGFHNPITVVQLRQVENVQLPEPVKIPRAA